MNDVLMIKTRTIVKFTTVAYITWKVLTGIDRATGEIYYDYKKGKAEQK